ncbi:SDR family oxidoreductase [Sphingomonas sp. PB2P12]|uniref:SDR family oxidoreductase n=1 Tax=Sphingomonas sandaracina TaxID=3096157 RepID=UPI002FC9282C
MTERRIALVTGGSKGIGAAIAKRLAADGMAVIVNYARGREGAEDVVAEITASGGEAIAVQADVSTLDGIPSLFDAAERTFGGLDILVNNAGVAIFAPIADVSDADFDHQLAVNIAGVFRGMREGARRLRDGGRIISFSTSVVGALLPRYGVYTATKAAVEAMTSILAKELGTRGITVNAVAPGPTATALFMNGKSEALVQSMIDANPLKRLGQPGDIASVVAFLASPDGGWVNGQTIRANGGFV